MNDLVFIKELMKQNYEALGFIPITRVEQYYMPRNQYVIQTDGGKKTGYIIHGTPTNGGILSIAQAVVDNDYRENGQGRVAVEKVIKRVKDVGGLGIRLRCAEDLESNMFWKALGFKLVGTDYPDNQRKRAINKYVLFLGDV